MVKVLVAIRPEDADVMRRIFGDEFEVIDKQPFDGPTFARFGDDVHVLGGALARAMRAQVVA